jgi:hypothetical protein
MSVDRDWREVKITSCWAAPRVATAPPSVEKTALTSAPPDMSGFRRTIRLPSKMAINVICDQITSQNFIADARPTDIDGPRSTQMRNQHRFCPPPQNLI